jgi:uncharacterized protein DUF6941
MEELEIEFMMVADGAQAVGGKLYVLGGGWTHLLMPQFPAKPAQPFFLAIGVTVPWHLTNRRFNFALELTDADNNRIEELATAQFEQGRPPGLRPGSSQRLLLSVGARPQLPAPGRYVFHASIDGQRLKSTPIEAVEQSPASPIDG